MKQDIEKILKERVCGEICSNKYCTQDRLCSAMTWMVIELSAATDKAKEEVKS